MNLYEVQGDLKFIDFINLYNPEHISIICQAVNCQGVQGAGLALDMKKKFPEQYFDYKHLCERHTENKGADLLGLAQYCALHEDNKYMMNAFTQQFYGRKGLFTDYDAVRSVFGSFAKRVASSTKQVDLYLPKFLGCGLAGGDWEIVSSIIKEELSVTSLNVIIVEF